MRTDWTILIESLSDIWFWFYFIGFGSLVLPFAYAFLSGIRGSK